MSYRPPRPTMNSELVPGASVAVRLGALQAVRLVAAAVAAVGLVARGDTTSGAGVLLAVWAAATGGAELARRRRRARATYIGPLLVVDAAVLAVAIDATGGAVSPVVAVVYLHVVLVASLIGTITGLRIALLHAFALYLVQAATTTRVGGDLPPGVAATHAAGYLLVAGGAALCGHLQATAARRGRAELRGLADLGPRLGGAANADAVAAELQRAAVSGLGFARAAVVHRADARWLATIGEGRVVELDRSADDDPTLSAALAGQGAVARRHLPPGGVLDPLLPDASDVVIVGVDGQPALVIVAEWDLRRGAALRAETLAALNEAASHAALAMATATLRGELERLATHDGLTALLNRATFDQRLSEALVDRRCQPVSVALVDLDHFKSVNDTYGHQVGDDVLRRSADAMRSILRPGDLAARYGGEELVLVLPGCGAADAARIAERLRSAIATAGTDPVVTASIGVATAEAGATASGVLAAADQALYRAKRSGRDRVVSAASARRRPLVAAAQPG